MDKVKWVLLLEVFERTQAELVKSYLEAHGVATEIVQEAYYEYEIGASAFGRVQVFVPSLQLEEAQKLYAESGWNFEITDDDDDEGDEAEEGAQE